MKLSHANYSTWSAIAEIFVVGERKIGYINGIIKEAKDNDSKAHETSLLRIVKDQILDFFILFR